MTLIAATEVAGLIVAIGGASVVINKGVRGLRRFARFLDSWFGDGSKHPSVPDRLDKLELAVLDLTNAVTENGRVLVAHVDGDAPAWLAEGQAWGHRLDAQVAGLEARVSALESGNDPVTGRVPPSTC